jgi:hypothetical protein
MLAALAILLLAAGCAGSANSTPAPTSTPSPTAPPTATATPGPSATPIATTEPGQMTHGRSTHTATELADGRVLVAGGYFNRLPIAFADLYSPPTDTFAVTGPMSTARGFGTATRLADGRVLFVGAIRRPGTSRPFLASPSCMTRRQARSARRVAGAARNPHGDPAGRRSRPDRGGNDTFNHSPPRPSCMTQ